MTARFSFLVFLTTLLVACALTTSFDYPQAPLRSVGGTVSGLSDGVTVDLALDATHHVSAPNGHFVFKEAVKQGAFFDVVATSPAQFTCSVENGRGTMGNVDIDDVRVVCSSTEGLLTSLSVTPVSDSVREATLSPSFDASQSTYVATVRAQLLYATNKPSVKVNVTPKYPGSVVTLALPESTPQPIESFNEGIDLEQKEKPIDVGVTAPNGKQNHYTLVLSPVVHDYIKAPSPIREGQFGNAIAVSGNTLVVGAVGDASGAKGVNGDAKDLSAPRSGAAVVYVRVNGAWKQQAYLKASNTRRDAAFGCSVAILDDTIAIGAYGDSSNSFGVDGVQDDNPPLRYSGAVYVFQRTGETWAQQAFVKSFNTTEYTYFGWSVALAKDLLVVGSPFENGIGTGVTPAPLPADQRPGKKIGAAYLYTRSAGTWASSKYIKPSTSLPAFYFNFAQGLRFGWSVAIEENSGDTIVVGAPGDGCQCQGINNPLPLDPFYWGNVNAGAVFAFVRSGGTWVEQAYIKAANSAPYANFGGSIALSQDTLAIGAPTEESDADGINPVVVSTSKISGSGAAYVFVRGGTTWSQQAFIKSGPFAFWSGFFGVSVALRGDRLLVGQPGEPGSSKGIDGDLFAFYFYGGSAGSVMTYDRSGTTWALGHYLKASNTQPRTIFGDAVGLGDGFVAIGSPGEQSAAPNINGDESDTSLPNAGAVYVY